MDFQCTQWSFFAIDRERERKKEEEKKNSQGAKMTKNERDQINLIRIYLKRFGGRSVRLHFDLLIPV